MKAKPKKTKPTKALTPIPKLTEITHKQITCDASNNPPTTYLKTLNIKVQLRFIDQCGEFFSFTLPIDLKKLREGKLKSVKLV
jgi:hypothetical protein